MRGHWQVEGDLSPEQASDAAERVMEAQAQGKGLIVVDGVTLRWHPAPGSLDAAWAEAVAALSGRQRIVMWTEAEPAPVYIQVTEPRAPTCEHESADTMEAVLTRMAYPSKGLTPVPEALREVVAKLREVGR